MLQTGESENEILLGNKQLLAIFFVVVLLLGVAFAGGYKLGQGSKKVVAAAQSEVASAPPATDTAGQTHEVPAGGSPDTATGPVEVTTAPPENAAPSSEESLRDQPLGSKKHSRSTKPPEIAAAPVETPSAEFAGPFVPQPGQSFLQVAAVGRDEAEAVADVLHKKGFRAHAVPKPGNVKIYRVLIGPLKDAGDLSATRDSLRRTGFREVITQRY